MYPHLDKKKQIISYSIFHWGHFKGTHGPVEFGR